MNKNRILHALHASFSSCTALLALVGCSPGEVQVTRQSPAPDPTNRLAVPASVVSNLGITYEVATRGHLGVWRNLSGDLEVPESHRWTLRAPARGRILSLAPRWRSVAKGDALASLASPGLRQTQNSIALAGRRIARASAEFAAVRERLSESEAHLVETVAFESAIRERLEQLTALSEEGNALTAREMIDARRGVTEASKARLDAAIARDELISLAAEREIEAEAAMLAAAEGLHALSVLTGMTIDELEEDTPNGARWKCIDELVIRAPASGVVVASEASPGEFVEGSAPVLTLFDTSELRFHGHIPEGDVGSITAGSPLQLEFPSRRLTPIETQITGTIPVADARTRMVHVEAVVPNQDGALAHGTSVLARVLVDRGEVEEVLIPPRCVVYDGLEAIVFKRDPTDPHVVVRTPVTLGARNAERVEVIAGVLDGDELVAEGIHQLKHSGLGKAPVGGHFHADGTWHADH